MDAKAAQLKEKFEFHLKQASELAAQLQAIEQGDKGWNETKNAIFVSATSDVSQVDGIGCEGNKLPDQRN